MIAVSLFDTDVERLIEKTAAFKDKVDILELRLDGLSATLPIPFERLLEAADNIPVIITNRRIEEGGSFKGDEGARIALLEQALKHGPAFIDVELETEPALRDELIEEAAKAGVKSICSWHDFEKTPSSPEITSIFDKMADTSADTVKIVTMARSSTDFLRLVPLFQRAQDRGVDIITFCMGEAGIYSRVCAPFMGSLLTFAAPEGQGATAPGQIELSRLLAIMKGLGWKGSR